MNLHSRAGLPSAASLLAYDDDLSACEDVQKRLVQFCQRIKKRKKEHPDLWCPSPELIQSLLPHSSLHTGHPLFELLPARSRSLLQRLEAQSNRWSATKCFKDGVASRRIMLLNEFHQSDRLVSCLMIPMPGRRLDSKQMKPCGLTRFCPFCAHRRGEEMMRRYARCWRDGSLHHLTLSLSGDVAFVPGNDTAVPLIWDCLRFALKEGLNIWGTGMFGFEELFVRTFYPTIRVLPHIHAVLHAEGSPDTGAIKDYLHSRWRELQQLVRGLLVIPDPDIRIDANLDWAHFLNVLEYEKPVDVELAYTSGFRTALEKGELEFFHQNVTDFFHGYELAVESERECWSKVLKRRVFKVSTRISSFCFGDCHGGSKSSICTPRKLRYTKRHKQEIDALRAAELEADAAKRAEAEQNPEEDL